MIPSKLVPIVAAAALLAATAPRATAQVHPEIVIGVNGAGKLVARFDEAKPYPLIASRFVGIEGYGDAIPGLSSLFEAKPNEDFFPPDPKSSLVLVLEGADDGIAVWNDHGTGTMRVGETFQLGTPFFDTHPIWNIERGSVGKPLALKLRVRDTTGKHKESDVFSPKYAPDDGSQLYVCPMRCVGGQFTPNPGRCATCGMALKLLSGRRYRVAITSHAAGGAEAPLRAGVETTLRFRIEAPDGKLVKNLDVVHEKLVHLLMVSSDLSWFAHEHPEIQADGTFTLKYTFPRAGTITLYHDFTPPGVGMQVVPVELQVAGEAPADVTLAVPKERKQTIDGYMIEMDAPSPIKSLQMQNLTFRLSRGGAPVTDLEPFLGAMGHLIVVSEDRKQFVHSHPIEAPGGEASRRGGPTVTFSALFPVPGVYKAWGQFQHKGNVITAPFVIEVASPRGELEPRRGGAASAPAKK